MNDDEIMSKMVSVLKSFIRNDGHDYGCSYDDNIFSDPDGDYCSCGKSASKILKLYKERKETQMKDKIHQSASSYMENRLRVCLFDCSDSMHEAEKEKNRFDGLTNDAVKINDYLRENLLLEYIELCKSFRDDDGGDLENPVCDLPIPYEEIKDKL